MLLRSRMLIPDHAYGTVSIAPIVSKTSLIGGFHGTIQECLARSATRQGRITCRRRWTVIIARGRSLRREQPGQRGDRNTAGQCAQPKSPRSGNLRRFARIVPRFRPRRPAKCQRRGPRLVAWLRLGLPRLRWLQGLQGLWLWLGLPRLRWLTNLSNLTDVPARSGGKSQSKARDSGRGLWQVAAALLCILSDSTD